MCSLQSFKQQLKIWINGEDIFVPVAAACRETIFQTVNALHIRFSECVIERRLSEWRPMFHIQCEMNNNAHKKEKYEKNKNFFQIICKRVIYWWAKVRLGMQYCWVFEGQQNIQCHKKVSNLSKTVIKRKKMLTRNICLLKHKLFGIL